ncbi:MAG: hypothetical protein HY774_03440 [Acidobacteria bacterium]|nr:hypothetical protein [Acidobacteriota bacterium]
MSQDLTRIKHNWSDQWEQIYQFIRTWTGLNFRPQRDMKRLQKLEAELGITLPPSAREWCFFGWSASELDEYFSFRDGPLFVQSIPEHNAIALLTQAEGDVWWAIETQDLDKDDPPIVVYFLNYEGDEEWFEKRGMQSPTVSAFAFDYFLAYMDSPGGGFAVGTDSFPYDRTALAADFGEPTQFGDTEYFLRDEILVFTSNNPISWHHEVVKVEFQRRIPVQQLPPSIQALSKAAYVKSGAFIDWGKF